MREIKFRGKIIKDDEDKKKGQWVYGLPQQRVEIHGAVKLDEPAPIGYIVSYEPERMLQAFAPDENLYWYEIDPKTLGEFIGLKDKNGKECYIDDIVKIDMDLHVDDSRIYQVAEMDILGFALLQDGEEHNGPYLEGIPFEVIGNIHENPELIKEGQ